MVAVNNSGRSSYKKMPVCRPHFSLSLSHSHSHSRAPSYGRWARLGANWKQYGVGAVTTKRREGALGRRIHVASRRIFTRRRRLNKHYHTPHYLFTESTSLAETKKRWQLLHSDNKTVPQRKLHYWQSIELTCATVAPPVGATSSVDQTLCSVSDLHVLDLA